MLVCYQHDITSANILDRIIFFRNPSIDVHARHQNVTLFSLKKERMTKFITSGITIYFVNIVQ